VRGATQDVDGARERRLDAQSVKMLHEIGARLRKIRKSKGWSLDDAVQKGVGCKASCLGAYERGNRTVSVPQLARIAEFYGVPVEVLISGDSTRPPVSAGGQRRLVIDLAALEEAPEAAVFFRRFVRSIIVERGDYNGSVLTVRYRDIHAIAALVGANNPDQAIEQLAAWGVLLG
jgi:transcriptional regulator with XRE-family HTH domain